MSVASFLPGEKGRGATPRYHQFKLSSRFHMDRIREPRTQDCFNFLNSESFDQYAKDFHGSYLRACSRVNLEPDNRANWPMNWEKIGRFCQMFWETLPDQSVIRKGAFFDLCNFAEDYTYGIHGN